MFGILLFGFLAFGCFRVAWAGLIGDGLPLTKSKKLTGPAAIVLGIITTCIGLVATLMVALSLIGLMNTR